MNCSFTPQGLWYVFCEETGRTLKADLKSKAQAMTWMFTTARKAAS